MQRDQLGHLADRVLRILQRLHPLPGQPRADHLVVMEADPAVRPDRLGRRLADVVHQRGHPQHEVRAAVLQPDRVAHHGQRVLVHVLVLGMLVDRELQSGQLGQEPVGEAGIDEQAQRRYRIGAAQQLGELVTDPFRGDPVQVGGHAPDGGQYRRVDREPQLRHEPGGAQHPQRVVTETLLRGTGGAQPSFGEVGQAAVRVGERVSGYRHRHRVHGEVAPLQVVEQAAAVPDDGVAGDAVVRLGAVRGDLQAQAAAGRTDRAELAAGLPGRLGPALEDPERLGGCRAGGEVQVVTEAAEQRVAHRAADQVQVLAALGEPGAELVDDREHAQQLGDGGALDLGEFAGQSRRS